MWVVVEYFPVHLSVPVCIFNINIRYSKPINNSEIKLHIYVDDGHEMVPSKQFIKSYLITYQNDEPLKPKVSKLTKFYRRI